MLAGQRVLRGAQVALARCGDASVGPGLSRRPLDGVVAVQGFLEQRVVVAFGVEASPHILAQHHVPVARKEPNGVVRVVQVAVLAVGPSVDQRREAARGVGAHHIGGQPGSIAHGHHDVRLAYDLVLGSLGGHG